MSSSKYAARLLERDIEALDRASDNLAAAAAAIRRANPVWGESVVQLLIQANEAVVQIHNKGAETIARWRARRDAQGAQDVPEPSAAAPTINQEQNAAPDEPEA